MMSTKINTGLQSILLLFFLPVTGGEAQAQDIKEVVQKISDVYNTTYQIRVQYRYAAFDGREESSAGEYVKGKDFTYLKAFETETIEADTFLLVVNHREKYITYTKREKKKMPDKNLADSLLNFFLGNGNITHRQNERTGELIIKLRYAQLSEVILVYSLEDYTIRKFVVSSSMETETGRVTESMSMDFREQKRNISIDQSEYTINRYVRLDGNKITPVAPYGDYEVYSMF